MKTFTNRFFENSQVQNQGITNHYTPVQNILTNINNLFCARLSIAASIGEDQLSIKLSSSKFIDEKSVDELLYMNLYNDVSASSLYQYITSQGLTKVSKINLGGGYWIVYFCPDDIKTAENPNTMAMKNVPNEALESFNSEFEFTSIITEDDSEEEMKSETVEKVLELLDGPDKVKAAKQLELLVSNQIQLPREFYFSAVKFKSGEEAIALRWKYTKKMPFGKSNGEENYKDITVENTHSILHIFGKGEKAIWVQDYSKDSLIELPKDIKNLIKNILDLLEASETDDPSVFSLTGERKEREDKDKDKDKENKDKDDEKNTEDIEKKTDNNDDDSESDDDRGGNDDIL